MALNIGRMYGSIGTNCTERYIFDSPVRSSKRECLFIDGGSHFMLVFLHI